MGVKSTFEISLDVARQVLLSKVYTMSERDLANTLECFKESEYRNYEIVGSPSGRYAIKSVNEFNNTSHGYDDDDEEG